MSVRKHTVSASRGATARAARTDLDHVTLQRDGCGTVRGLHHRRTERESAIVGGWGSVALLSALGARMAAARSGFYLLAISFAMSLSVSPVPTTPLVSTASGR